MTFTNDRIRFLTGEFRNTKQTTTTKKKQVERIVVSVRGNADAGSQEN